MAKVGLYLTQEHPRPLSSSLSPLNSVMGGGGRSLVAYGKFCPLCNLVKLHFNPNLFLFCTFGPFPKAPELSNSAIIAYKFYTFHYISVDFEKMLFQPPSDKFKKLHLGLNVHFDCKPFYFFSKLLKGCSTY